MKNNRVIRLGYTAKNTVTGYQKSAFSRAKLESDIAHGVLNSPIEYGIVIDSAGARKGLVGNQRWGLKREAFHRWGVFPQQ